jgi:hypothetical protein
MRRLSAFIVLLLLCCSGELSAQSTNASVTGYVTDPNKAVIVGAKIIVINVDTNVRYEATTNNVGSYDVNEISPGPYRIEVEKLGFKTVVQSNLILHVQDRAAFNFEMAIGSLSEIVTVETGGLVINTTDGTVGTVIDRKFVENIPLNGRSFQDLISLTPGVVSQPPQMATDTGIGNSGDFSVNGQRTEANYYTVDGVSANSSAGSGNGGPSKASGGNLPSSTVLGTTQSLISVDALQEFRVQSSSYSAEYGRTPGGQFSLVTRSGANDFHGSAFDYLRNEAFDANNWFNNYFGQAKQVLRQNDFGGTLGGPVRIPVLYNGKDKTFFFVSYEGLRLTLPQAAAIQYVPDTYMREQAPAVLQPILNAFPVQNGLDYGTAAAPSLAQFIKGYSIPSSVDSVSVRIDEVFSPKLTFFFRYGGTPSSTSTRSLSTVSTIESQSRTYTGGMTNQVSPVFTNQFRIGRAENTASGSSSLDSFGGAVPVDLAGAFGVTASPEASPAFVIYLPGVGESFLGIGSSKNESHQWNVVDVADYSLGKHLLKFGADYRRITSTLTPATPNLEGFYESAQSVLANRADLMFVLKSLRATPIFNQSALFVQDEWHVASRLNFSFGLRWEVNPAPTGAHGNDAYTLRGNISQPSTLNVAPLGTPLWNTSWFNFAPRFGVAWKVRDKLGWETVLRGGGGVFFDSNNQTASYAFGGLGFSGQGLYSSSPLPLSASQLDVSTAVIPPYTNVAYAFPEHLQLPYTLEWNVSVQQSLGKAQALTVSYIGADGRRLQGEQELLAGSFNPNFQTIVYIDSGLTSNYNALQVQLQRNVSRGINALASYTYSHSIDFGSNYAALPFTRGNSDFDLRHSFSAGATWDLPRVSAGRFVDTIINNWGVDGRLTARSGFPISIAGNNLIDPVTGSLTQGTVNIVPNVPVYLYGSQYPGGRAINAAAFSLPPGTQNGDAPRNFVRGFGELQMNMAVRRDFPISERARLQFRADAFNILNRPNFGYVDAQLGDAAFGLATQMLNQSLATVAPQYQQGGPRSMQFSLKLLF